MRIFASLKNALAHFARTIHLTRGTVRVEVVDGIRTAGYEDMQIVDILLVISAGIFTNHFNRVNDTISEFPKVE